jgi:glutamate synthase (NADPH) large chain
MGGERAELGRSYRRGIRKGLLKILSKMGISRSQLPRRAAVRDRRLPTRSSRVLRRHALSRIRAPASPTSRPTPAQLASAPSIRSPVEQGGLLKYVHGGEYHMYNPDVVARLQARS